MVFRSGFSSLIRRNKRDVPIRLAVCRAAQLAALVVLVVIGIGCGISNAQISDAERTSYADALAYCSRSVSQPIALRADKRVLCLNEWIVPGQELLASHLEPGGYFVVRGFGGDLGTVISLATIVGEKNAVVVVRDYCLAACASYLLMASAQAFVPRDSLVAWINLRTGLDDSCLGFVDTSDRTAPYLHEVPCPNSSPDLQVRSEVLRRLKERFFNPRVLDYPFKEPPESLVVRRALKRKYDDTGKYPDKIYWTWHPRYYARTIKTRVLYEAYPQSQGEVDAIAARIQLPHPVIYDP